MASNEAVSAKVRQAADAAARCFQSESVDEYEELNRQIHLLDDLAREALQIQWADRYWPIVDKLENGRQLSDDERSAVELLIVGEAAQYLSTENNYDDWTAELTRLVAELERTDAAGYDQAKSLLHVQALCRDVRGVLPDVTHYLRERDRIQRFRTAFHGDITPDDGRFVASVIRDLIRAPNR